jgi:hypothetical protein
LQYAQWDCRGKGNDSGQNREHQGLRKPLTDQRSDRLIELCRKAQIAGGQLGKPVPILDRHGSVVAHLMIEIGDRCWRGAWSELRTRWSAREQVEQDKNNHRHKQHDDQGLQ